MSFRKRALKKVRDNREKKLTGGFNSIPFGYKRLEQYVPGLQKANYVIITANSGIGKSKFTKNMYVFRPFDFIHSNPHLNIKFHTLYFCLEEPGESFIQSLWCYKLRQIHKLRVSIKELRSQLKPDDPSAVVSEDILEKLDDLQDYTEKFEECVTLIDDVKHPYGIYRRCVDFLESVGDYNYKPVEYWDPKKEEMVKKLAKDNYFTNHEDHYIQIVIDHVGLLEPEKGQDLFEAIRTLSNRYLVQLRNRYHCSIVVVQQQASDKEKQQYTYKGASIESKLEPSLDGLGDCKLTQRDADEIFGIFSPDRYEIKEHAGYDITQLLDNYRSFKFLKTRDGEANKSLGFLFDGATNNLWELPPSGEMDSDRYTKALRIVGR
jgi:hypothetical protein